jgi:hypothetical protein
MSKSHKKNKPQSPAVDDTILRDETRQFVESSPAKVPAGKGYYLSIRGVD